MLKKEADLLKKQIASNVDKELAKHKLASQFTEVPEERDFACWHPFDAIALAIFVAVVMLFFV